MKKLNAYLLAVALLLGMTQCKKEQPASGTTTDGGETVYITMKVDNGGRHIVYPGTGAVVYGEGDVIYVGNGGHYVGSLTYHDGAFSGNITSPNTADYLHFYFVGGQTPSVTPQAGSTTEFTVSIADQSSKLPVLSYGQSNTKYIDGNTAYTCMLENQCGLVKFVPSMPTSKSISVSGMNTTATIDFATPGITPTGTTGDVTLYTVSNAERWAILLPQAQVDNTTANITGYTSTIACVPAVTNNMYYSGGVEISMSAPLGGINGLFSVSETKQVFFSKGNLQYIGSAGNGDENNTGAYWKFADHQWVRFGKGDQHNNTSATIDRDLFGWGTSGYHDGNDSGNKYYLPWSTQYGDFNSNTNQTGYGPSTDMPSPDLTDASAQYDWGVYNTITGAEPSGWRTLTKDEWDYVINTRQGNRFATGNVGGQNGLILLPDNWNTEYYTLNNINAQGYSSSASFESNVISEDVWVNSLEAHGAVFLPTTGTRSTGTWPQVSDPDTYGVYWTTTHYSHLYAWYMIFQYDQVTTFYIKSGRYGGFGVRLVYDVE